MQSFFREILEDILIEVVNIERATYKETDEFRNRLKKDFEEGWRKIIVDLKYNLFMDSTFLGSLITSLKTVSKLGGDLRIAGVRGDTKAIFEFTGTSRVFKIFKSREAAVNSFKV